jgi:hypothetical protein
LKGEDEVKVKDEDKVEVEVEGSSVGLCAGPEGRAKSRRNERGLWMRL